MSNEKSGVEKVINSLSDFENELEEIKNKSEIKKTELINTVSYTHLTLPTTHYV